MSQNNAIFKNNRKTSAIRDGNLVPHVDGQGHCGRTDTERQTHTHTDRVIAIPGQSTPGGPGI